MAHETLEFDIHALTYNDTSQKLDFLSEYYGRVYKSYGTSYRTLIIVRHTIIYILILLLKVLYGTIVGRPIGLNFSKTRASERCSTKISYSPKLVRRPLQAASLRSFISQALLYFPSLSLE